MLHATQRVESHLLPVAVEESRPAGQALDIHQLRDRGWTRQMVSRFLNAPDGRRPATKSGGRPAELFALERVRAAERTLAFSDARRQANARSAQVRTSQRERRETLLRFAENVELTLPDQDLTKVIHSARRDKVCVRRENPGELADCAVNALLDMLSPASHKLDVFHGQPGIREARAVLLKRKLDLIRSRYPALSVSCGRF